MNNFSVILNENAVYLESFGAAETVTGSKPLLRTPAFNLLIAKQDQQEFLFPV
ncbi:MAG: hypothetical protein JO080_05660 [Mucilaginibacter sp.]|nr:hypothetical protein [Mucilaginibacter sp.]